MTRNRLLTVMVALTLVMQAAILYRTPARRTAPPPTTDAPQNVYFDLVDFPVKDSAQAKAVIVEFSDYECPFCARHATTVLPELMKRFVDGGLVRYALANNPLPMHPNADWLARMALCAGEQGRYWDIHHGLFASKPASHPAAIALADPLDLDRSRLQDCADADSAAHRDIIERDQELARRLGLVGTPAFAVGRVQGGQRVHVQKLIRGALPFDVFRDVIEEVVERAS